MVKCLVVIALFSELSEAKSASHSSIEQWEVIDIRLQSKILPENPYKTNIWATFTHKTSGNTRRVPLVFNGDNEWLLRFSASTTGEWAYEIEANALALNESTGEVDVVKNADPSNKGAMVLGKKPQTFSYEDGSDYFLVGFELDWLFALDYKSNEGLPKSEHMLSRLQTHGFNHIVMNIYAHDVSWKKDPKLAKFPEHEFGGDQDIFPFLGSNENPDFSRLNIEFFKKFDRTMHLLHDKRMVAHLMIYVWNKMVSWPDMNTPEDNMYFDYVVKRYSAFPNVVWDISKEALFYGRADEAYIKNRIERLRGMNSFDRLVTVHDYKYCSKYPEQVDFISTQDWGYDIYNRMLNVRKRFPDKVIYNIEHGGYEASPYLVFPGDYVDPEVSVRRNWHTLFAGVYSTYYWQASSWNVIIYNPFEQPEDFIKPRWDYFTHLSYFFKQYPFDEYVPVPGKNGSGMTLHNPEDDSYLVYVSKDNYQMSRLNWILTPSKERPQRNLQWFNTLTGEMSPISKIEKSQLFISPWRGTADAVLIATVAEK